MSKRILIIDDEELVLKTLAKYLKTCGYAVESACSGEEAIKKVKTEAFDLIISDVRMPGMDGIETIKKLRETSRLNHSIKIPEIIITGYASEQSREEAEKMGINSYIYKPFDIETFINAVKNNLKE